MPTVEPVVSVFWKNVLLATDLSPASERGVQFAQAFAREQANVLTLHVNGSDNYQLLCPELFSATFKPARDSRSGKRVLGGLLHGLPCEVPVSGTRISKVIADVAGRNEIDLLILDTQGHKGVAEEVLGEVACPVLTVGFEARIRARTGLKFDKVLLASDCSSRSLAPVHAARLCRRFSATLFGLHVVERGEDPRADCPFDLEQQLVAMAPEIYELDRRPEFMVEHGEPAAMIVQVAVDIGADLIVLGAHAPQHVRIASHLPWATASRVIAGAPCPVLTVRDAVPSGWNEPLTPDWRLIV